MGAWSVPGGRGVTPGRDLPGPRGWKKLGPEPGRAPGSRPAMTSPLETSLASPLGSKPWESRSEDHLGWCVTAGVARAAGRDLERGWEAGGAGPLQTEEMVVLSPFPDPLRGVQGGRAHELRHGEGARGGSARSCQVVGPAVLSFPSGHPGGPAVSRLVLGPSDSDRHN